MEAQRQQDAGSGTDGARPLQPVEQTARRRMPPQMVRQHSGGEHHSRKQQRSSGSKCNNNANDDDAELLLMRQQLTAVNKALEIAKRQLRHPWTATAHAERLWGLVAPEA